MTKKSSRGIVARRRVSVQSGIVEEEDSNVNADNIVVDCCEQEIYNMLVECNMNPHEAITRLLSQGFFNKVAAFFYLGFISFQVL